MELPISQCESEMKWLRKVAVQKFRHRVRTWWRITFEDCVAPLTNSSARLKIVTWPCIIYVLFQAQGFWPVAEELHDRSIALASLALALPFFAFTNAFFAIFKTVSEERKQGFWEKHRFVLYEPKRLITLVLSQEDHGRTIPVQIPGLPRNASIEYQWERPVWDTDTQIALQHSSSSFFPFDGILRSSGMVYLNDEATVYVQVWKSTPSNPSTIHVRLLSWWMRLN